MKKEDFQATTRVDIFLHQPQNANFRTFLTLRRKNNILNMVKYSQEKYMVNAAAALIIYRNKFLLAKRAEGEYKDKWEFPKGNIEGNETAFEAVKREIQKRFGIEIFPYQSIKRFTYHNTESKGQLVLIKCSILSRWQDVSPDSRTYADYIWTYILNTENLDFAPVDKNIVSFLLQDKTVLPHKTRGPGFASMDTGNQRTRALRMKNRGLASMNLTKRQLIAQMGGKAAHAQGKAHTFTSEEASRAGRIGGLGRQRKYRELMIPIDDKIIAEMFQMYAEKKYPIAEICRKFHITRTMLYKYFNKYAKPPLNKQN